MGPSLAPAQRVNATEAAEFIRGFYAEHPNAGDPDRRIQRDPRAIDVTGTYWHTPAELAYAARVAWRNAGRCIGRLYWRSLRVRDRRDVTSAGEIAAECVAHLREATNGGKIGPLISRVRPRCACTSGSPDLELATRTVRGLFAGGRLRSSVTSSTSASPP